MAETQLDAAQSGRRRRTLGEMVYDPKLRSIVLQLSLLAFVFGSILWIVSNTVTQLAAQGKKSGFGFLFEESGFQILTTPGTWAVGFEAGQSTYLDIFMLGIVNTVSVSILGIIAATFLGFVLGVFRLSSNFVLRTFATAYVELFRNIPLLLQLFIWYKAIVPFLPDRRAEEPWVAFFGFMQVDRSGFWMYYPEFLPGSGVMWLALALSIAAVFGLRRWAILRKARTGQEFPVFWVSVAVLIVSQVIAYTASAPATAGAAPQWYQEDLASRDRVDEDPRGRFEFESAWTATALVACAHDYTFERRVPIRNEFGRSTGETVTETVEGSTVVRVLLIDGAEDRSDVILGRYHAERRELSGFDPSAADCAPIDSLAPVQWEPPTRARLGGFQTGFGAYVAAEMFAVWVALTLYTAAFIAEIVRAGILAVNKGQREAASALGLRNSQTLNFVVIPQALRVIIPPLTSQFLNLTKNSSLAVAIAYPDVVSVFAGTALNQVGQEIEMIFMMMMVYLFLSITISIVMNWYNRRIALVER